MRIKPGMEATLPCEPELGPLYLTERVELTGLQENPERNALRGTALEWVRCAHARPDPPTNTAAPRLPPRPSAPVVAQLPDALDPPGSYEARARPWNP